jgi:hypothetical protein
VEFAVNVDPAESDLTKLTQAELESEVWPSVPFLYHTTWENVAERPVMRMSEGSPLAKGLLYAVLALLFVELFMSWRLGRARG